MSKVVITEQVSRYHPDKYADQISDKIVSVLLGINGKGKVAVETLVKDDIVIVAGEISSLEVFKLEVNDFNKLIDLSIYSVANDLGYKVNKIYNYIGIQSVEIQTAVDNNEGVTAGDQGFMYGYATRETPDLLPYGHFIANKIINKIEYLSKTNGGSRLFCGDAKVQVITEYDKNNFITVKDILCSVQHSSKYTIDEVRAYTSSVIRLILKDYGILYFDKINLSINPAGSWTVGGPIADAGLTGRKIVADQYGGDIPVGGGAFSGKDLTKVDRSAAYVARLTAMDLIKNDSRLEWVLIKVGYSIGVATPTYLVVDSNIGDISSLVNPEIFIVSNMLERLKNIDFYKISQGCHYRDLILSDSNE